MVQTNVDISTYGSARLRDPGAENISKWISSLLPGVPPVSVPPSARVRVHRFDARLGKLIAFERNINYQMSEDLKQAGGNESLEKPIEVQATLDRPMHVYDLRTLRYLGFTTQIRFKLDPWQPSLFAVTADKRSLKTLIADLTE